MLTVRKTGFFSSDHTIADESADRGLASAEMAGFWATWSSHIEDTFSDRVPVEVQAFVIYVVMMLHLQQAAAATG